MALAIKYRSLIKRIGVSEYGLPGFGYETFWTPTSSWDLYQNWQLAFFSVPDAAQFFIQGREKEMLAWYFYHSSYSGNAAIPTDHLDRYTREISKPGFLRSGFEYFATATVASDSAYFNSTLRERPLEQPMLVLGGESSLGGSLAPAVWGPTGTNISYDTIPKAGHWIGMENPFPLPSLPYFH